MRDADFRKQQRGSLGWAITNYAGTDPTRTLGGARGPLQLVNYGDITPGKTGQVLAYNPSPYKTLIPGIQRVHTARAPPSSSMRIRKRTSTCCTAIRAPTRPSARP